jgi:hypothetical protein
MGGYGWETESGERNLRSVELPYFPLPSARSNVIVTPNPVG